MTPTAQAAIKTISSEVARWELRCNLTEPTLEYAESAYQVMIQESPIESKCKVYQLSLNVKSGNVFRRAL